MNVASAVSVAYPRDLTASFFAVVFFASFSRVFLPLIAFTRHDSFLSYHRAILLSEGQKCYSLGLFVWCVSDVLDIGRVDETEYATA